MFYLLYIYSFWVIATQFETSASANVPTKAVGANPNDFILVSATFKDRLSVMHSTRPLRHGIRTFIVLDDPVVAKALDQSSDSALYSESYSYYPDRKSGLRKWESRYVAAPFLAHEYYKGAYKWMLIGDDDTLWFMTGVYRLLRFYNSALPYFISDNLVDLIHPENWDAKITNVFTRPVNFGALLRPSWLSISCLPCHATKAAAILKDKYANTSLAGIPWRGCPCRNVQGCRYRAAMCKHQTVPDPAFCSLKHDRCSHSWPWGGAGMIASVGLLNNFTWEGERGVAKFIKDMETPEYSHHAGDFLLSLLIYERGSIQKQDGYGITLPSYSALLGGQYLLSEYMVFAPVGCAALLEDPYEFVKNGACDRKCRWLLKHVVTQHASVTDRYWKSPAMATVAIRKAARSMKAALQLLGEPHDHIQIPLAPVAGLVGMSKERITEHGEEQGLGHMQQVRMGKRSNV
mmetsp:Transcript_15886/g.34284  ORF Transcript_15886/g.34284 Transcript_15886/m.34284 type:complete len:461 (+) Transcript_15886:81-1463(+)